MKLSRLLSLAIIVSFAVLVVFGLPMSGSGHHENGITACIASLVVKDPCEAEGPFAEISAHLEAFHGLLEGIAVKIVFALLAALFLAFVFSPPKNTRLGVITQARDLIAHLSRHAFLRWLSRCSHSPTL